MKWKAVNLLCQFKNTCHIKWYKVGNIVSTVMTITNELELVEKNTWLDARCIAIRILAKQVWKK
jgi:hypothetical protein